MAETKKVSKTDEQELKVIRKDIKKHKYIENFERVQAETKRGFRVVTYEDKEYVIHMPKPSEEEEILQAKSRLAGQLLKDERILSNKEILETLYRRGIWTKEDEEKAKKLNQYISEELARLFAEYAKDEPDEEVILKHRREKNRLERERELFLLPKSAMMTYSLENQLEVYINRLRMAVCVKDKEGNRIWKSPEDIDHAETGLIRFLSIECQYLWFGFHPDLL